MKHHDCSQCLVLNSSEKQEGTFMALLMQFTPRKLTWRWVSQWVRLRMRTQYLNIRKFLQRQRGPSIEIDDKLKSRGLDEKFLPDAIYSSDTVNVVWSSQIAGMSTLTMTLAKLSPKFHISAKVSASPQLQANCFWEAALDTRVTQWRQPAPSS